MFFDNDEEEIMVTNAVHQLISKSAITKFKNMIAAPKTNTLREQKLAILLENERKMIDENIKRIA